jgi:hypothetical protein
LGNAIMGANPNVIRNEEGEVIESGMPTMEEMMREAMGGSEGWNPDEEEEEKDEETDEAPDTDKAAQPGTPNAPDTEQ